VLGFRRGSHHAFLLSGIANRAFRIEQMGRPVGYAYVSPRGHIGPVAFLPCADAGDVLNSVVREALEAQPEQLSILVPGEANRMLNMALALGFRLDEPLVLLSAQPFGNWSHYVPSNPGFM
jgi:hypothetical protein